MQALNSTPRGSKRVPTNSPAGKGVVAAPGVASATKAGLSTPKQGTTAIIKGKGKAKALINESPVKPLTASSGAHSGARLGQSVKAGLQFSVPRVARFMKQGRYADRIGGGAPIYLTAALQYICSEIVELAGNEALRVKKQRIVPRHVMLAIRNDPELNKLVGHKADFANSGVVPKIHKEVQPGKKGGKGGKCGEDEIMEDDDQ